MNESRGTRYRRRRRRLRAADAGAAVVVLSALALTPASVRLAEWSSRPAAGLPPFAAAVVSLGLFVLVAVLAVEVVRLPFRVSLARLDRRYGSGRGPDIGPVLSRTFKAVAASLLVCWSLASAVRLAVWLGGGWWWLVAATVVIGLMAAAIPGAPRLVGRLAGTTPVSRPELRERLAELARQARVRVSGVDELHVDSDDRTTAFVGGAGRFRRVFVASTLVRDWSDDEVAVVVAHELGHHVTHDLWRTLALDGLTLAAAFAAADVTVRAIGGRAGLPAVDELAALPLLAVVAAAVWLVLSPLRHAQSRRHERRADAFALAVTDDADAFDAVIRRLGERHLVEERPPLLVQWLSFRHPTIGDRLRSAQAYRRGRLESPAP